MPGHRTAGRRGHTPIVARSGYVRDRVQVPARGVSSPWIFSAANTCRRMPSTIGCSSQTAWPTQSFSVERSKIEPVAGVDLALPVERQVIGIF